MVIAVVITAVVQEGMVAQEDCCAILLHTVEDPEPHEGPYDLSADLVDAPVDRRLKSVVRSAVCRFGRSASARLCSSSSRDPDAPSAQPLDPRCSHLWQSH